MNEPYHQEATRQQDIRNLLADVEAFNDQYLSPILSEASHQHSFSSSAVCSLADKRLVSLEAYSNIVYGEDQSLQEHPAEYSQRERTIQMYSLLRRLYSEVARVSTGNRGADSGSLPSILSKKVNSFSNPRSPVVGFLPKGTPPSLTMTDGGGGGGGILNFSFGHSKILQSSDCTPVHVSLHPLPFGAAAAASRSHRGSFIFNASTTSMVSQQHDLLAQLFVKEAHAERGMDGAGFDTINNYAILQELGRGSYGKVMLACDEEGNKVAIKSMPCGIKAPKHRFAGLNLENGLKSRATSSVSLHAVSRNHSPCDQDSMVMREVAIMKKLRHKNIVQLREVIHDEEEDQCHLVMDYICNGAVAEVQLDGTCVNSEATKSTTPRHHDMTKHYIRQAAAGLQYLHKQNIIHRDIKPENLLVGAENTVYLADFGVSAVLREDKVVDITAGTQVFFSPELCRGEYEEAAKYGKQSDIWALGVTFYAIVFGKVPFHASNVMALATAILSDPVPFPSDLSIDDPLRGIFEGLLHKDPEKRWTLKQLWCHPVMRAGSNNCRPGPLVSTPQPSNPDSGREDDSSPTKNFGLVNRFRASVEDGAVSPGNPNATTFRYSPSQSFLRREDEQEAGPINDEGSTNHTLDLNEFFEKDLAIEVTEEEQACAIVQQQMNFHTAVSVTPATPMQQVHHDQTPRTEILTEEEPKESLELESGLLGSFGHSAPFALQWQNRRRTLRRSLFTLERTGLEEQGGTSPPPPIYNESIE